MAKSVTSIHLYDETGYTVGPGDRLNAYGASTFDIYPDHDEFPVITRRLGIPAQIEGSIFSASDFVVSRLLRFRTRLVVNYDDASQDWFRVRRVRIDGAGLGGHRYEGEEIWADLAFSYFNYDGGLNLPLRGLTFDQALDKVFSGDYGINTSFKKGTVETALQSKIVSIDANATSHLDVIMSLCQQVGCEFEFRIQSAENFYFDFYAEAGWTAAERTAGNPSPANRPVDAPDEGGEDNLIGFNMEDGQDEYFSHVLPYGGEDQARISCAGARWPVAQRNIINGGNDSELVLEDDAIWKTNTWEGKVIVGYHVGGEKTQTPYATVAPNILRFTGTTMASSPDVTEIEFLHQNTPTRISAPYVYDKDAEDSKDRVDLVYDVFHVPPYDNDFAEAGGSADMSAGSGGAGAWFPTGLGWKTGSSGTTDQETGAEFVRYGTSALKVQANAGSIIETKITLTAPTDTNYISVWLAGRVTAGRVRLRIVDSAGTSFPPGPSYADMVDDEILAIAITETEFAAGTYTIEIEVLDASTVFYLDALTATYSPGPWEYQPEMGKRAIYLEGAKLMLAQGGIEAPEFETDLFDPNEVTQGSWDPFEVGSWVRLKAFEGGISSDGRITEIQDELNGYEHIQRKVKVADGTARLGFAERFSVGRSIPTLPISPLRQSVSPEVYYEGGILASANWDGTWDRATQSITAAGTQGWALSGGGDADITGTLHAGGGGVTIGDDGIVLNVENAYTAGSSITWQLSAVDHVRMWAEGVGAPAATSFYIDTVGTINLSPTSLLSFGSSTVRFQGGAQGGAEYSGTATPDYKFEVYGSDGDGDARIAAVVAGAIGIAELVLEHAGTDVWKVEANTANAYVEMKLSGTDDLHFTFGANNRVRFLDVGAIELAEVTEPTGSGAGWGLIYVDSVDSDLYFKPDGGTRVSLTQSGGGSGDVTAAANLTDHAIIRGDNPTAGKGVQHSGWLIDDSDVMTAAGSLVMTGQSIVVNDVLNLDGTGIGAPTELLIRSDSTVATRDVLGLKATIIDSADATYDAEGSLEVMGLETLRLARVAAQVNYIRMRGASASGYGPYIHPAGTDTNIPLTLFGKGTGRVFVDDDLEVSGHIDVVNGAKIQDTANDEWFEFDTASGAGSGSNHFKISRSKLGADLYIDAVGASATVAIQIRSKGAGVIFPADYLEIGDIAAPGAPPLSGDGRLYAKTGTAGLFWHQNGQSEVDLTAVGAHTHDINTETTGNLDGDRVDIGAVDVTETDPANASYLFIMENDGTGAKAKITYPNLRAAIEGDITSYYTDADVDARLDTAQTINAIWTWDDGVGADSVQINPAGIINVVDTAGLQLQIDGSTITTGTNQTLVLAPNGTGTIRADSSITTPTNTDLTLAPNGTGNVVITSADIAMTGGQYIQADGEPVIKIQSVALADGVLVVEARTGGLVQVYTETAAHDLDFVSGTGNVLVDGSPILTTASGLTEVKDDTTPQLGGPLDVLAQDIFDSTGDVSFDDTIVPKTDSTYNCGSDGLRWLNLYADNITSGGTSSLGLTTFTGGGTQAILVQQTGTAQYSAAGISFQHTNAADSYIYRWFTDKDAAGAGLGDTRFRLRVSNGSEYLDLIAYDEGQGDLQLNSARSASGPAYGNVNVVNGTLQQGGVAVSLSGHTHDIGTGTTGNLDGDRVDIGAVDATETDPANASYLFIMENDGSGAKAKITYPNLRAAIEGDITSYYTDADVDARLDTAQSISAQWTFTSGLLTGTIGEEAPDDGVTIDGVLLKDSWALLHRAQINLSGDNADSFRNPIIQNAIEWVDGNGSFQIVTQDSAGRVNMYWNAYYDSTTDLRHEFMTAGGDRALNLELDASATEGNFYFRLSDGVSVSAGDPVTWEQAMRIFTSASASYIQIGESANLYELRFGSAQANDPDIRTNAGGDLVLRAHATSATIDFEVGNPETIVFGLTATGHTSTESITVDDGVSNGQATISQNAVSVISDAFLTTTYGGGLITTGTNESLNVTPAGTGTFQYNGVEVLTVTGDGSGLSGILTNPLTSNLDMSTFHLARGATVYLGLGVDGIEFDNDIDLAVPMQFIDNGSGNIAVFNTSGLRMQITGSAANPSFAVDTGMGMWKRDASRVALGPAIALDGDTTNPSAYFYRDNALGTSTAIGGIGTNMWDTTSGSEDADLSFATVSAGTFATRMYLQGYTMFLNSNQTAAQNYGHQIVWRYVSLGNTNYSRIRGWLENVTATTESGGLVIQAYAGGTADQDLLRVTGKVSGARQILAAYQNGSASEPQYSWIDDSNTGFYQTAANENVIHVSVAASQRALFNSNGIQLIDGTAANPSYTFINDTNTGFYRPGVDRVGITLGGQQKLDLTATPTLTLYTHNAASNNLTIAFYGDDDGSAGAATQQYGQIVLNPTNAQDSTEAAQFEWYVIDGGTHTARMLLTGTSLRPASGVSGAMWLGTSPSNLWAGLVYEDKIINEPGAVGEFFEVRHPSGGHDLAMRTAASATDYFVAFVPAPAGTRDYAKEFGFEFTNNRWFFDEVPYLITTFPAGVPMLAENSSPALTGTWTFGSGASIIANTDIIVGQTASAQVLADADAGAGLPAYAFDGDTNTGFYQYSADTIGVSTAGTLRFYIGTGALRVDEATATGGGYKIASISDQGEYLKFCGVMPTGRDNYVAIGGRTGVTIICDSNNNATDDYIAFGCNGEDEDAVNYRDIARFLEDGKTRWMDNADVEQVTWDYAASDVTMRMTQDKDFVLQSNSNSSLYKFEGFSSESPVMTINRRSSVQYGGATIELRSRTGTDVNRYFRHAATQQGSGTQIEGGTPGTGGESNYLFSTFRNFPTDGAKQLQFLAFVGSQTAPEIKINHWRDTSGPTDVHPCATFKVFHGPATGAPIEYFRVSYDTDKGAVTILNSAQLRAQDGTAAAPGVSFSNDTDTGMYRAATQLGFAVGGSTKLRWENDGWRFYGGIDLSTTVQYVDNGSGNIMSHSISGIQMQISGSASIPTYRMNDANTGWYGSNQINGSVDGNAAIIIKGDRIEEPANVGTTFPTTPPEGQRFYRSDLEEWFYYDSSRSKWLGTALITLQFGYSGTTAGAQYMRAINGMTCSSTLGYLAPYTLCLVGASCVRGNTSTGNIEIRDDGTNVDSVFMSTNLKAKDMAMNVTIAEDSVVNAYASMVVTNAQIQVFLRRTAT